MVFIPNDISQFRFRRSALFMPASNERALKKAKSVECDCLIFDLEDSVAPNARDQAHSNLLGYVKNQTFNNREIIIRISSVSSKTFQNDFSIALQCEPHAILLPKVESARSLVDVDELLDQHQSEAFLWGMIETPLALVNLKEICTATPRLKCIVIGTNDLAKDTGTSTDNQRRHLNAWLMMVLAHARAFKLSVLDGVYNNFQDVDGLLQECIQGAAMGFDGKTLIHPNQIEAANKSFIPSSKAVEEAKAIIEEFAKSENAQKGAIQINGEMIERLHLESAQKLMALIGRL